MKMHTYRYRFLRRYGPYAAGDEADLTEGQAIALDNEAPGVLERVATGDDAPTYVGSVTPPAPTKSPRVTKEDR